LRPSSPPHSRFPATRHGEEGLMRLSLGFVLTLRVKLSAKRRALLATEARLTPHHRKGGNAPTLSPQGEREPRRATLRLKSSTHRCFAVKRLCRGGGVPNRGPKGRSFLYPSLCRELLRPFSLGYFSFTPGILPSALRAGFAVRTRSCACVGQKKSDSSDGSRSKRPPRRRHPGDSARTRVTGSLLSQG
jgi:hypothetical protein